MKLAAILQLLLRPFAKAIYIGPARARTSSRSGIAKLKNGG